MADFEETIKVFLEAKSNLLDHDLFLTYARLLKVTPYSYLARGDWVLKWRERA